jgi:hypothetical protein
MKKKLIQKGTHNCKREERDRAGEKQRAYHNFTNDKNNQTPKPFEPFNSENKSEPLDHNPFPSPKYGPFIRSIPSWNF